MTYTYRTRGTCASQITFDINDNIVSNVSFYGGCNGNLKGIGELTKGMEIDEVISRLENIKCGLRQNCC